MADTRSLLVVVDTSRPEQVLSEDLLFSCNRVAVIDHHRRAATYISNATLNYHEPYASSASEQVSELLQYLLEPSDLLRAEAEALLAGIVLDTRVFPSHRLAHLRGRGLPAPLRRRYGRGHEILPQRFYQHHRQIRHHPQGEDV
jgi:c-di-AMP phosphodiesterase-like protein